MHEHAGSRSTHLSERLCQKRLIPRRCAIGRRIERRFRLKHARIRPLKAALGVVAAIALVAAVAVGAAAARRAQRVHVAEGASHADGNAVALSASEATGAALVGRIEVPRVTGMQLSDAEDLLAAGSLAVRAVPSPAGETTPGVVLSQEPAAGTVVDTGTTVTLWFASDAQGAVTQRANDPDAPGGRFVVCVDPGHQERANPDPEPIGPGAKDTVPKVTEGARGVVTRQTEAEVALQVALALKRELEALGVTVVLTRTTNAVDISNAERARIANGAGADLYVRLHAEADTNGDVSGIRTLYPEGNEWVAGIAAASKRAAEAVHRAVVRGTGASDRGIEPRSDLAGFNWSRVPVVLVQCGYLSNPVEDRKLATAAYRSTLARSIATGVLQYLEDRPGSAKGEVW